MPNNLKLFSLLVIVALFAVSSAINENDESNVMKKEYPLFIKHSRYLLTDIPCAMSLW